MGKPPLWKHNQLQPLINCLNLQGKKYISDTSFWIADSGDSIGWNLQNLPSNLQEATHQLQSLLKGCAPIHNTLKDKRGWGNGVYSINQGYSHILSQTDTPPKDKIWNSLWINDNPPKVNSFCWIVVHDKLLTGENLLKRNIHGPFRCELCRNAQKNLPTYFPSLPLCYLCVESSPPKPP